MDVKYFACGSAVWAGDHVEYDGSSGVVQAVVATPRGMEYYEVGGFGAIIRDREWRENFFADVSHLSWRDIRLVKRGP